MNPATTTTTTTILPKRTQTPEVGDLVMLVRNARYGAFAFTVVKSQRKGLAHVAYGSIGLFLSGASVSEPDFQKILIGEQVFDLFKPTFIILNENRHPSKNKSL